MTKRRCAPFLASAPAGATLPVLLGTLLAPGAPALGDGRVTEQHAAPWVVPEWFKESGHIQSGSSPWSLLWQFPPEYERASKPESIFDRGFVTGDWWGARSKMADAGLYFLGDYTQFFQSVVSDGTSSDFRYGGKFFGQLVWDAAKADVIKGGLLQVTLEARYGESVNTTAGLLSPPNTSFYVPYTPDDIDKSVVNVTDVFWVQTVTDEFSLIAGKMQGLDSDLNEFASGRGVRQFMNGRHVFNNALIMLGPYSALGAGVIYAPNDAIWGYAAVEQFSEGSEVTGFDNFGDGWLFGTEWYFQYRMGDLPGGINVGFGYGGDLELTDLGGRLVPVPGVGYEPQSTDSTWGVWLGGWQYVYVAEDIGDRWVNLQDHQQDFPGLGVFARVGWSDQDSSPYPFAFSLGLGGRGLIPGRPRDTFGVGYSYLDIENGNLTDQVAELAGEPPALRERSHAFEAYYNLSLTPSTGLTFNAQVVEAELKANGTPVILGMRLNIAF